MLSLKSFIEKELPQSKVCISHVSKRTDNGNATLTVNNPTGSTGNPNRALTARLNINSLRNKFEILKQTMTNKADNLLISETKLDSSFPLNQFHIDGFTTPYRLDRNQNGGGIMLYIRDDIPSKSLTDIKLDNEIENILIEINLRSKNG